MNTDKFHLSIIDRKCKFSDKCENKCLSPLIFCYICSGSVLYNVNGPLFGVSCIYDILDLSKIEYNSLYVDEIIKNFEDIYISYIPIKNIIKIVNEIIIVLNNSIKFDNNSLELYYPFLQYLNSFLTKFKLTPQFLHKKKYNLVLNMISI